MPAFDTFSHLADRKTRDAEIAASWARAAAPFMPKESLSASTGPSAGEDVWAHAIAQFTPADMQNKTLVDRRETAPSARFPLIPADFR